MTLQQAIKKYNLIKQEKCFDGEKLPNGYELYTGEKHTEKADYFYTVDRDLNLSKRYYLVKQAFYKDQNKETTRTYILED